TAVVARAMNEMDIAVGTAPDFEFGFPVHEVLDAALAGTPGGPAPEISVGAVAVPVGDHRVATVSGPAVHDEISALVGHDKHPAREVTGGVGSSVPHLDILPVPGPSVHREAS